MFLPDRLIACCALALAATTPAIADSYRNVGTLITGEYLCSLPGDAAGEAMIIVEDAGFTIVNGSSYVTNDGRGTYLRVRDQVTFTSGPFANRRMVQESSLTLRAVDGNGEPGAMLCTRHKR